MTTVVDPDVTRLKFERELELWHENEQSYRRRGWILLGRGELTVDIGFVGRLPIGAGALPAMTACVRFDFTNYDLWPPSVEFIDPLTGEYAPPTVQALIDSDHGPQDIIVQNHPDTGRAFFCVPGIRQYHDHPQHSGDSWLLHRESGEGTLATVSDRIWRSMARNLLGIHFEFQTLPGQVKMQLRVQNAPGDVAPDLWEKAKRNEQAFRGGGANAVLPPGVPQQVLAALGLVPPGGQSAPVQAQAADATVEVKS